MSSFYKQWYWTSPFMVIECATVLFSSASNFKNNYFLSFFQLTCNLPELKFGIWVKSHFSFNGSSYITDTPCCPVFTSTQAPTNITFQINIHSPWTSRWYIRLDDIFKSQIWSFRIPISNPACWWGFPHSRVIYPCFWFLCFNGSEGSEQYLKGSFPGSLERFTCPCLHIDKISWLEVMNWIFQS